LDISEEISSNERYSVTAGISGGYILVISTGFSRSIQAKKKALIGIMPWSDLNAAVINEARNFPLVVAGNTLINGDVVTGPASVVEGEIEGIPFQRETIASGSIETCPGRVLPEIDKKFIEYYLDILSDKSSSPTQYISGSLVLDNIEPFRFDDSAVILIENKLEINSQIIDQKADKITLIVKGSVIIRGDSKVTGNIEIVSARSILIEGQSFLENVILAAEDSIVFSEETKFRGQAIAGRMIKVKDNCRIYYPSLLYVYNDGDMDENSLELDGDEYTETIAVIECMEGQKYGKGNRLVISPNSTISGFVFSSDYSEIRGQLNGISMTQNYYYEKPPSVYMNWLNDAMIDRDELKFLPILPAVFPNISGYAIYDIMSET
jgi:hypothetical protein